MKPTLTAGPKRKAGETDETPSVPRWQPPIVDQNAPTLRPAQQGRIPRIRHTSRPRRIARTLDRPGPWLALLALAALGVLTARAAGWGGMLPPGAGAEPTFAPGIGSARQAQVAPPSSVAGALPQSTSVVVVAAQPTATSAAAPSQQQPAPAVATAAPLPITFTCASAVPSDPAGDPGYERATLCLDTQPNAAVNLAISYCPGALTDGIGITTTGAAGHWETNAFVFHPTPACALPYTVTVTASGTDPSGDTLSGSATFTVTQ